MIQPLSQMESNGDTLICKNLDVKICLICGCEKIEFFEFGISCEECGSLLERKNAD